ncbi:uncharacterized protein LOC142235546 [Haematobia irritans]|uniref:uncharacterized protein LOC142235546 n=1 Tax=Haematobia irritans TaxID=7368 RepID=UPI003F4F8CFF
MHLQNILDLAKYDHKLLVCGDFNLSKIGWSLDLNVGFVTPYNVLSTCEMNTIDGILSINLIQINRFFNKLNRILDLIFIDKDLKFNIAECLNPFSMPDMHHSAIELEIEFYSFINGLNSPSGLNFKNADFVKIQSLLEDINWSDIFGNGNVNVCFDKFINILNDICYDSVPCHRPRLHKLPWYTKGLKRLKNQRNKFYNDFRRTGSLHNFEVNIKSNPKSFWSFINSKRQSTDYPSRMFLDVKVADSLDGIVDLFAQFFTNNFVLDANAYPIVVRDSGSAINIGLIQLSDSDLLQGLSELKSTYRVDSDGLCSAFLIQMRLWLIEPLLYIFNKSLREGVFLDRWKTTSITPVFKSGQRENISNYRPIAKLSNIAKLFERILVPKLYFEIKSIISPYQHGFIKGRSTVTNLVCFSQYCISSFELGYQVDTIYTDLKKAFDRISHSKLIENGLEINVVKCIKVSFSRGRNPMQFVYTINSSAVEEVVSYKDLGVVFDSLFTPCFYKKTLQGLFGSLHCEGCLHFYIASEARICINYLESLL